MYKLIDHINKCKEIIELGNKNSITNLISDIIYYDLLYRSFNEGLRLDKQNDKKPNSIIGLIHESFFDSQVMKIRRLLDNSNDVYSLRKVLNEIIRHEHLYTREEYILLIDPETIQKRAYELLVLDQHRKYDQISGKTPYNRAREDKLNHSYLMEIKAYLDKPNIIVKYTNTFVAHSLNKEKQVIIEDDLEKVSLRRLQENYKLLSWLSFTLSFYCNDLILFDPPTVLYEQFENWVGTIFKKDIELKLYKYWEKRAKMFSSWQDKYWMSNDFYISPYRKVNIDI
jgi:hypothetical protein